MYFLLSCASVSILITKFLKLEKFWVMTSPQNLKPQWVCLKDCIAQPPKKKKNEQVIWDHQKKKKKWASQWERERKKIKNKDLECLLWCSGLRCCGGTGSIRGPGASMGVAIKRKKGGGDNIFPSLPSCFFTATFLCSYWWTTCPPGSLLILTKPFWSDWCPDSNITSFVKVSNNLTLLSVSKHITFKPRGQIFPNVLGNF